MFHAAWLWIIPYAFGSVHILSLPWLSITMINKAILKNCVIWTHFLQQVSGSGFHAWSLMYGFCFSCWPWPCVVVPFFINTSPRNLTLFCSPSCLQFVHLSAMSKYVLFHSKVSFWRIGWLFLKQGSKPLILEKVMKTLNIHGY